MPQWEEPGGIRWSSCVCVCVCLVCVYVCLSVCVCVWRQKLTFGSPASVLTQKEEKQLVEYATHMGQIGNGCTHEKVPGIVSDIVNKDGHPNPFLNARPGRKWW